MKVYKREKGGRWYALFFDEKTERRKEKALNTSSEQEAERKRAQWQAECDAGLLDPFSKTKLRKPLTLREALDRYLAAKEEAQRSPETIRNYRTRLNMLLAYVGENRPPRSLSTREIQEFITEEHQRDASKATRFRHVRAFCRWMQEEEILVTDPTKRITYQPRKKEVLPSCVRPDQLEKLCETVRTDWYDKICCTPKTGQ